MKLKSFENQVNDMFKLSIFLCIFCVLTIIIPFSTAPAAIQVSNDEQKAGQITKFVLSGEAIDTTISRNVFNIIIGKLVTEERGNSKLVDAIRTCGVDENGFYALLNIADVRATLTVEIISGKIDVFQLSNASIKGLPAPSYSYGPVQKALDELKASINETPRLRRISILRKEGDSIHVVILRR